MNDKGFIGNSVTGVFHRPFCPQAEKIRSRGGVRFATVEEANKVGFEPCSNCRAAKVLVGNCRTLVLHFDDSPHSRRMRPDIRRVFDSYTSAIDSGYRICYCAKKVSGIFSRLLSSRPPSDDQVTRLCTLYHLVASTELVLSYAVRRVLWAVYANQWWRRGVPPQIRKDCAVRREDDPDEDHDVSLYMDFIHYKDIVDKNWEFFREVLPPETAKKKQDLLRDLNRFNRLRNRVMHPSRGASITQEDSPEREFLVHIAGLLRLSNWRFADFERLYDER